MTVRVALVAECDECGTGQRYQAPLEDITLMGTFRSMPLPAGWERFVGQGPGPKTFRKDACDQCIAVVREEFKSYASAAAVAREAQVDGIVFARRYSTPMPTAGRCQVFNREGRLYVMDELGNMEPLAVGSELDD